MYATHLWDGTTTASLRWLAIKYSAQSEQGLVKVHITKIPAMRHMSKRQAEALIELTARQDPFDLTVSTGFYFAVRGFPGPRVLARHYSSGTLAVCLPLSLQVPRGQCKDMQGVHASIPP